MLVGKMTAEELFAGFPAFGQNAAHYRPEPWITATLKRIKGSHEVLLFLGTWCGDSEAEAPKIIKALQAADNPRLSLTIIGVDRTKRDWSGMAERFAVDKVPTTVVLRHGRETGRIVEYPRQSAEADLLRLVAREGAVKSHAVKKRGRLGGGR